MGQVAALIWQQYGGPWLFGLIVAGAFLHWTGAIRWLIGAHTSAADRLVADRQDLTKMLTAELQNMSARHREALDDLQARHRAEIQDWRRWNAEEKARADDQALNAQRWRHLLGRFGMIIQADRRLMTRAGVEYPRVDFSEFIAAGGDPKEFDGL